MDRKKVIEIGAVCVLFLFLAGYVERSEMRVDAGNRIVRAKPGGGSTDVNLTLSAEGLFEDYRYPLSVREMAVTEEEAGEYFEQAKEEIDRGFFAEGEDADCVTQNVRMAERYVNGLVEAEWRLDSYRVMEVDGSVIDGSIPETGEVVNATAVLTCGGYRVDYSFGFIVYPKARTDGEKLLASVESAIEAQMASENGEFVSLPEEVDGYRLVWEETKKHLVWKVLFFEIVILILLHFVKQERVREQERNRREQMRLDYPEVVNKLLILLGAGMSLKQAWDKISARYSDKRTKTAKFPRYIYEEMLVTSHEISDGESERRAYQNFGERTGLGVYHRLVRILIQNLSTGSRGLCQLLEQESQTALEERKALARKLGEEAGTRLLLPMMLMLVIVIAIIMVPAMLSFNV